MSSFTVFVILHDGAYAVAPMATILFLELSAFRPFLPHADGVALFAVVFLEGLVAVVMPAFPVSNGVVVFVVALRFHLLVAIEAGPLPGPEPFLVLAYHDHIAKPCPALDFSVGHVVLVGNLEFLDAVVVPFVPLQDLAIGVNPYGGLLDTVGVSFYHLFLGSFHGTTAKERKNTRKSDKMEELHGI